jgi:5-methylcytosine-specific restriction endonuclease McrA
LLQGLPHEPYDFSAIIKTYKNRCHLCGKTFTKENPATRDHRIPVSKGGPDIAWNIAPAHKSCNSSKNTRVTPTQLPLFTKVA